MATVHREGCIVLTKKDDMSNTTRVTCDCGWANTIGGSFTAPERAEFVAARVRDHLLLDKRHADRQQEMT